MKSVVKLFSAHNNQVQLDPPIRQGQTRYPFLVMLFGRDEEMQAALAMDE